MADRSLLSSLTLARGRYDRAAERRSDEGWWGSTWTAEIPARLLVVSHGAAPVSTADSALVLAEPQAYEQVPGTRVLLGVDDGVAYLGLLLAADEPTPEAVTGVEWWGLRDVGAQLSDRDSGLLTTAVALANWHDTHTHCPRCGSAMPVTQAGWARHCPQDGSDHFPRSDPAVIVLVLDQDDRALLGHRKGWPGNTFSTLAGFVEAGESAEMTVVREMAEEAGVRIDPDRVGYLGSQPWPFPWSLMLGYHAYVAADSPPALADGEEIELVRWFTRAELSQACESGDVALPGTISIARRLIEDWYGGPLPGDWSTRR